MASCAEARFYLENCGLSSLDRDHDGVPASHSAASGGLPAAAGLHDLEQDPRQTCGSARISLHRFAGQSAAPTSEAGMSSQSVGLLGARLRHCWVKIGVCA